MVELLCRAATPHLAKVYLGESICIDPPAHLLHCTVAPLHRFELFHSGPDKQGPALDWLLID